MSALSQRGEQQAGKSLVAIQACPTCEREVVDAAVASCLDALGGMASIVQPGARVLCKVNLLQPATPEQAICTHPEMVRAVVRQIRQCGGVPLVGDNPAMARTVKALRKAGILAVLEEEGVEVPDLSATMRLENPDARHFRSFEVSRAMVGCDVLFNLPKLKTHALTYMTCAMKNLFGLIPGTEKARWHIRAQTPREFAILICDLFGAIQRHFQGERRMVHLCDGILAMEGEGPGAGGKPRQLGALLASRDAVALDRIACEIAGLEFERLVVTREAMARGQGDGELDRLRLIGTPIDAWKQVEFMPPPVSIMNRGAIGWMMGRPWIKNQVLERPVLDPAKCSSCYRCEEICPAQAITMQGSVLQRPTIDLNKCIRCYCCTEVCPEGAMHKSQTPWLGRVIGALG